MQGRAWRYLTIEQHVLEVLIGQLLVLGPHIGSDGGHHHVIASTRGGEQGTLLIEETGW